jgi:hypothetical protein
MSIKIICMPLEIILKDTNETKRVMIGIVPNGTDVSRIDADEKFFCFLTVADYFSVCAKTSGEKYNWTVG